MGFRIPETSTASATIDFKVVIDAFATEGLDHVRLCIGGARVSDSFAEEIGAHGYAPDASSAVDLFKRHCAATHQE
jgi:5-methyltetrahydrofolate--homocysteine methyltransferase